MTPQFDPVWPWSLLGSYLAGVGPRALPLALLLAGLAVILPPTRVLLPGGRAGRVLRLVLLALPLPPLVELVWLAGGSGALASLAGHLLTLLVPPLLVGLSLAAYLTSPGVGWRRRCGIALLRLLAFALAFLAVLRPSLGFDAGNPERRELFIVIDFSRSMTLRDESSGMPPPGGQGGKAEGAEGVTRWQLVTKLLRQWEQVAERLEDRGTDVRWLRFAGETSDFDPAKPGEADGKRTDFAAMFREAADRRDPSRRCLGFLVVSDGADHGGSPALAELGRYRNPPCPVSTFSVGSPKTTPKTNDLAITAISTEPTPFVPLKARVRVKLLVDARGYEGQEVKFRLWVERPEKGAGPGAVVEKEEPSKLQILPLSEGNAVELECEAPDVPGEYKLRVEAEAKGKDVLTENNRAETFITVSREGVRVLLVDKLRWETKQIRLALTEDPRIRVTPVYPGGEGAARGDAPGRLFRFDEEPPDVIVLGDVTPAQVRALDPKALERIAEQVGKGSGLLLLGGYASFGNSEWEKTPLEPLFPVDLGVAGQVEADTPVRLVPTEDGLRRAGRLFKLDDRDPRTVWERMPPLEGMTKLSLHRPARAIPPTVLARTEDKEPLLVMSEYSGGKGKEPGRVLAFGGDTTWKWVTDEEREKLHGRFWRQVILWLARQEDARGGVWVKPDVRRIPAGSPLGFEAGVRGKGGVDLTGGTFTVAVTGPDGVTTTVPMAKGAREGRGTFTGTAQPGTYRVVAKGEAPDPSGGVVTGEASVRVQAYAQDLELTRAAADLEFLGKLAAAGGGEAHRVQELTAFLERLAEQPRDPGRARRTLRPDWRAPDRSGFLLLFFVTFVAVVSGEWFLRRRWGLV